MWAGAGALRVAGVAALLTTLMVGSAWAQGTAAEVCGAPDKRQACSFQCCGRRSCPPSCEVDCVKACVDSCASPDRFDTFLNRMRQLQIRCGNRAVR